MGLEDPKELQDAPELSPGLEFFWEAFFDLTTCRQAGVSGFGPIPYDKMVLYAEMYELDDEEILEFTFLIKSLDAVYVEKLGAK